MIRLVERLKELGRTCWVDLTDVNPTEEWRNAIKRGIEGAPNFIFVISPSSIVSEFCNEELIHAASHNKRLIPVLRNHIEKGSLPEVLSPIQWIHLTNADYFETGIDSLVLALDIDVDYVRTHSRILGRALEWAAQGKNSSYLLRGGDLRNAEVWLAYASTRLDQRPTSSQVEYILAGRKAKSRSRRTISTIGAVTLIAVVILMILYRTQRNQARSQTVIALSHQLAAESELLRTQGFDLLPRSVLLAIESLRRYPSLEGDQALRRGLSLLSKQLLKKKLEGPLRLVTFSPNGKYLATTKGLGREIDERFPDSKVTTAWILDATSGSEISQLHHSDNINALCYSPDGNYIASGSDDKTARIWNALTGVELRRFGHSVGVAGVQFSSDGRLLVTTTNENQAVARVWEVATWQEATTRKGKYGFDVNDAHGKYLGTLTLFGMFGRQVRIFNDRLISNLSFWEALESRAVNQIILSEDTKFLAAIWDNYMAPYSEPVDYTIRIYNTTTRKEVAHIKYEGPFENIIFSPDNKYFLIVGAFGWVHSDLIYETDGAKLLMRLEPEGLISSFQFSSDSKYITAVFEDGTVRTWQLSNRLEVSRIVGDGLVRSAAVSPNNQSIATSSETGTIQLWQISGGQHLSRVLGEWSAFVSPDGKRLIGTKMRDFGIWEFPSATEILRKEHEGLNFKFSSDRRYLATDYQKEKSIHVWETMTGAEMGIISDPARSDELQSVFMPSAVSSNGNYVLTESDRNLGRPRQTKADLLLWDVTTGIVVHRLPHPDFGYVAEFSPDGSKLATTGDNILIWDTSSGQLVRTIAPNAKVDYAVFSPSGKYFISAGKESMPQIWDVSTGAEQREFEQGDARSPMIFSRDERYLAYTMKDGSGRIWDALNNRGLRLFHPGGVEAVGFSPLSDYLATREISTSSGDFPPTPRADIWEVKTGLEVTHFDEQYGHFQAFSPDERYIVTQSYVDQERLGIIWILPWRREDLVNEACNRLTRNLTMDEWSLYLHDQAYRKTCPELP